MKNCGKHNRILSFILTLVLLVALMPNAAAFAATGSKSDDKLAPLTVTFLDVGQGDSAVLECGGKVMMIDGGKPKESSKIYSWLKSNAIDYIDYMVASHPDADHIGGLSGALNYAKVGKAYCSTTEGDTETFKDLVKYLGRQNKKLEVPEAGDTFSLGDADVEVLGPTTTKRDSDDTNNSSLVLKVTLGETSFLFTGDAEWEEEQDLLDADADLKSTILKVSHHGSAGATSYRFLREVDPEYAVISVGADNTYGHPTEEVLSRLRDADVKTFRTDMQGDITAVSDGKGVTFSPEKNADADTLADSGAGQKSKADPTPTPEPFVAADDGGSSAQTYVLNTNTHKFHYPDCSSVKQMKDKNKEVVTESRDQIISEGYEPCKRCNP